MMIDAQINWTCIGSRSACGSRATCVCTACAKEGAHFGTLPWNSFDYEILRTVPDDRLRPISLSGYQSGPHRRGGETSLGAFAALHMSPFDAVDGSSTGT
jgi:hypothetical protein